jgi:predicted HicB family RNase H-like nuclease
MGGKPHTKEATAIAHSKSLSLNAFVEKAINDLIHA